MIKAQQLGDKAERESLGALNRAARGLIYRIRTTEAPAEVLDEAREQIERAQSLLAPYDYDGPLGQASLEGGGPLFGKIKQIEDLFPYSPLVGPYNPVSPPLVFEVIDGVVHGSVIWGAPYCGPPNHVHGGIVAAAFDELLGAVNVVNEVGAMTGTLTVRYRKPTPLFAEIRMEGRHTGVDGRKVYAEGKMWHGDLLLAEAEGIFIQIQGDFRDEMLLKGGREVAKAPVGGRS